MFINYGDVENLAKEKGANTRRVFIALGQLARMNGGEETVKKVMAGDWSVLGDGVSLDDKSDPNRSEFDYLYSRA